MNVKFQRGVYVFKNCGNNYFMRIEHVWNYKY